MESGNSREKIRIRKEVLKKRKELSLLEKETWDRQLSEQFFAEFAKISVFWIYLYMDFRSEAGTGRILEELWHLGFSTAIPRVEGRELNFYPVRERKDFLPGYMGILEPLKTCPIYQENALVLVPGVAFDALGNRIGYGGGFYDRFFAREPNHLCWGLAYDFQIFPRIPCEKWDKKVEKILTPKRVIETPKAGR